MKNPTPKEAVQIGLRMIIGGVFLYAGWQKIHSLQDLADSIAAYRLLPQQAINLLAIALPSIEILIGVLLIVGLKRRVALFSALFLVVVFGGALSSALIRGLTIDCGCFGSGTPSRSHMWLSLGRDLLLGGTLAYVYYHELRLGRQLRRKPSQPSSLAYIEKQPSE